MPAICCDRLLTHGRDNAMDEGLGPSLFRFFDRSSRACFKVEALTSRDEKPELDEARDHTEDQHCMEEYREIRFHPCELFGAEQRSLEGSDG